MSLGARATKGGAKGKEGKQQEKGKPTDKQQPKEKAKPQVIITRKVFLLLALDIITVHYTFIQSVMLLLKVLPMSSV